MRSRLFAFPVSLLFLPLISGLVRWTCPRDAATVESEVGHQNSGMLGFEPSSLDHRQRRTRPLWSTTSWPHTPGDFDGHVKRLTLGLAFNPGEILGKTFSEMGTLNYWCENPPEAVRHVGKVIVEWKRVSCLLDQPRS